MQFGPSQHEVRVENQSSAVPVSGAHDAPRKIISKHITLVDVFLRIPGGHFVAGLPSVRADSTEFRDLRKSAGALRGDMGPAAFSTIRVEGSLVVNRNVAPVTPQKFQLIHFRSRSRSGLLLDRGVRRLLLGLRGSGRPEKNDRNCYDSRKRRK